MSPQSGPILFSAICLACSKVIMMPVSFYQHLRFVGRVKGKRHRALTGFLRWPLRSVLPDYANGSLCVDRFSNRVVLLTNVSFTVPVGPFRCLAMITSAMLS